MGDESEEEEEEEKEEGEGEGEEKEKEIFFKEKCGFKCCEDCFDDHKCGYIPTDFI